jgi:hypothetical protein
MGESLASLTIAGVSGVAREDAGSASGLAGVAHQLGGALGLAVLVVAFAIASPAPGADARAELAHRIGFALSTGAVMLAAALLIVLLFIVRRTAPAAAVTRSTG